MYMYAYLVQYPSCNHDFRLSPVEYISEDEPEPPVKSKLSSPFSPEPEPHPPERLSNAESHLQEVLEILRKLCISESVTGLNSKVLEVEFLQSSGKTDCKQGLMQLSYTMIPECYKYLFPVARWLLGLLRALYGLHGLQGQYPGPVSVLSFTGIPVAGE